MIDIPLLQGHGPHTQPLECRRQAAERCRADWSHDLGFANQGFADPRTQITACTQDNHLFHLASP